MMIAPINELDAVNEILSSIGETMVNSLEGEGNVDVANARSILSNTTREILSTGWTFNTIDELIVTPDKNTKKIKWDNRWLRVIESNDNYIINRDGYVYDVTNQTNTFDSPITIEAVILVDFEEVPEAIRKYITAKAALAFSSRFLGDNLMLSVLQAEYTQSKIDAFRYDVSVSKPNITNNQGVQDIMSRG